MARGVDNTRPLSDGATYFIIDDLGRRQLRQVQSHQAQSEGGLQVVTGAAGVLGKQRQAGGYTVTVTVKHSRAVRDEVAWEKLRQDDASFTFEIQYRGGQRKIYRDCGVSTISESVGEDGNVSFEIALVSTKLDVLETATA